MITKLFGILNREMARGRGVGMPRDTRTGGVLENMVLPALERGGYQYKKQVVIGKRLGGPEGRRIGVESSKRANPNFVKMATDIWDRGTKGPIRNPMSS